jgi:RNA polymerase sigma-70 factor, ECF subfamily
MDPQPSNGPDKRTRVAKAAFQYRDALLSHSYAMLRDWAQAEDVLQEAFVIAVEKGEEFQEGSNIYSWVRQIVHFKTLEALRARKTQAIPQEEELLETVAATLESHLDEESAERQKVRQVALQECVAKLERFQLGVLEGFYWQSKSCEELAVSCGKSVNAVRLLLSRLRQGLRDCVQRQLAIRGTDL